MLLRIAIPSIMTRVAVDNSAYDVFVYCILLLMPYSGVLIELGENVVLHVLTADSDDGNIDKASLSSMRHHFAQMKLIIMSE